MLLYRDIVPEEVKDKQAEPTPTSQTSSYRSIFKATSLFGGLQVYQILISVIKSKFAAVLLGPAGIGVIGLFQSAMQLIQSLSAMGLASSAVRDVSEANGTGDQGRINRVVTVLRRLVWFTGLLGMLIILVLSPVLSKTTFGNYDYVIPFMFLSVTLLLDQICSGQRVVLQGMRHLKHLAKASAYGQTLSLIVTVPIYYFWGVRGIVSTLVLSSTSTLIFTWWYSKKIRIEKEPLTTKQTLKEGSVMLRMGWAMSLSSIMAYLSSYVLRGFIRQYEGTETVGLYTAGFAILTTYVGMVFTAIGTDYYPRLAAVNKDQLKANDIINQQGEIASLLLGPMLLVCVIFMPVIVRILYSESFLDANSFILLAVPGMMFKLCSWLVAYQYIAKADMKLFIINEIAGATYGLVSNLLGFYYWGLTGLGISFTVSYFIYMIQVIICTHKYYHFRFTTSFQTLFIIQSIMVVLCLALKKLTGETRLGYSLGSIVIVIVTTWSLFMLNKKINLLGFLQSKTKRWP